MSKITLSTSDITDMAVDAIVCPAHKHLIRDKGLPSSIFDKAGDDLVAACNALEDCPVGEARLTDGFQLNANYIIHTVTPQWTEACTWGASELRSLRSCYDNVLDVAVKNGVKTIAFPVLGSGTLCAPDSLVAKIGAEALKAREDAFDDIVVVVESEKALLCWQDALGLVAAV